MDDVQDCKKFKTEPVIVKPEDENEVTENCPVEVPPQEKVFSIDHILAEIFGFLDTPSLFSCRLVSHRFLSFAQGPLENRISKYFYYKGPRSRIGLDSTGRTFAQLTEFLEQSKSAAESNHSLFSFPCTDFWIYGPQLGDRVLQKFLRVYGLSIKKLKICPGKSDNVHENIRMKQLCKLLTIQAPYMETLIVVACPKVEWHQQMKIQGQGSTNTSQNPGSRSRNSVLLKTDPEFQQISAWVESCPRTSSLKNLIIAGQGLAKTMECLFQLSPKLQQVDVRQGYSRPDVMGLSIISYSDYRHLLEPVNRIHLLKTLAFHPDLKLEGSHYGCQYICFDMGTMEKISLDNNLKLRELEIDFRSGLRACETSFDFENQVVVMLNRILEGSKETLERLCLRSFTFLRGLKMPTTMPNVKEIQIEYFDCAYVRNSTLFPKGFSLTLTFPQLTSIRLVGTRFSNWEDFYCLENYLNFRGDEEGHVLSLGVKKVILDLGPVTPGKFTSSPVPLCRDIYKFFPNSLIEVALQKTCDNCP